MVPARNSPSPHSFERPNFPTATSWRPLFDLQVAAPVLLVCVLLLGLGAIPVGFFFGQIQFDSLRYYIMADHLAKHGSASATFAINTPDFLYPRGIAYFYAPVMVLFDNLGARIRAIQIINCLVIGVFYALTIRYFRRFFSPINVVLVAIAFAFCIVVDMRWQTTAMALNADGFHATLTVLGCLVAGNTERPVMRRLLTLLPITAIGVAIKITFLVIPVAFIIANWNEILTQVRTKRFSRATLGLCLIVMIAAAVSDWSVISRSFNRVFHHPNYTLVDGGAGAAVQHLWEAITNLLFSALPTVLVPNFRYLFLNGESPLWAISFTNISTKFMLGVLLGAIISGIAILGAIRSFKKQTYEICLLLLCIGIFALVANSTDRYLMAFSPMLWVFTAKGINTHRQPLWRSQRIFYTVLGVCTIAVLAIQLIMLNVRSNSAQHKLADAIGSKIRGRVEVYRGMLSVLHTKDSAHTALLWAPELGDSMPWGALTTIPTYDVTQLPWSWARDRQVLLALSCRHPMCSVMDATHTYMTTILRQTCHEISNRRTWNTAYAKGEIAEIKQINGCVPSLSPPHEPVSP